MQNWFVVYSEFMREDIASNWLRGKGIEVFFPQRIVRLHRQGCPYDHRPAFPRYLFCRIAGERWGELRHGRGISDILHDADHQPCIVPDKVIAEIMSRCDPDGVLPMPAIRAGQEHLIINGNPLRGLVAMVEKISGANCQAWVNGLRTRIKIADLNPEPVKPVLSMAERKRISLPLEARRKQRDWTPVA